MRNYELLFILDPAMDEAARNQMIETVKGIINAEEGRFLRADSIQGKCRTAKGTGQKTEDFR